MAGYLMKWVWDQQISPIEKLVLFALNEHTNPAHGDWRCYPSHSTLARLTGMSRRALITSIQSLERAGLIRVAHQFDSQGRQQQNMYWLNAPFIGSGEGAGSARGGAGDAPPGVQEMHGGRVQEMHTNPLVTEPLRRNPKAQRSAATPFDALACPLAVNAIAWSEWVEHRRHRRKPISQRAATEQWRALSSLSPEQQAACIAHSIRNDYQGLFPDKFQGGANADSNRLGRDSSPAQQRSAVGRVRANAARELAASQSRSAPVDVDDRDVRPPLDICVR